MIDPELVTRKMRLIGPDLEKMQAIAAAGAERYLADSTLEALAERYLERVIGRMIDINFHLITESGQAPPSDYYESFLKLGAMQILPRDFARSVAACAGLRNRIVHEYDELDPALVYPGLKAVLKDIPDYLRHIESFLRSIEQGS